MNGVLIASLYAPNGNPQPGPKFDYKLAWMERLAAHAADALRRRRAGRAGRRLQRRADRPRHLSDQVLRQGRAGAAGKPRAPSAHPRAGLDRRDPHAASGRADVHVLGLHAEPLAARRRPAPRSSAAERRGREAPGRAPASTARCAARTAPAIMRRPGSCCSDAAERAADREQPARQRAQASGRAKRRAAKPAPSARPLLVDRRRFLRAPLLSRAAEDHPARSGGKPAGAILGFANFLLRLLSGGAAARRAGRLGHAGRRRPIGTRHFPPIRAGASSTTRCSSSSTSLPEFVAACGFANAKAAGYEADDFLAAAVAAEEKRGGTALVASGDRDTFQLASERTTILYPVRAGEMARIGPAEVRARYGVEPAAGAGFHRAARRSVRQAAGRARRRRARRRGPAAQIRHAGSSLAAGRFPAQAEQLRLFRDIATMNRQGAAAAPARPDAHLGEGRRARP